MSEDNQALLACQVVAVPGEVLIACHPTLMELFAAPCCGRYDPSYISLVIHPQMSFLSAKGERVGFFLLPYGCF